MNKKKESKVVPNVRFKGFTDDWKQCKLGEVSESYSGGTPSVGNKSYYGGSIPFIRSAEINSESTELFLTEEGLTNSSARMVSKGDILYALYGATSGETGRSRINGAINQAILAILPHDGYDSEFLMQWLRKSKQNITDIYLQGGQGNLSGAIVKDLEVNFPSLAEQRQIGNYFQSIDKLITLHQQKITLLTKLKKAMLEKMFPKKGSVIPEFRFNGFANAWEQRKVSEITKFHKQGFYTTEEYDNSKKYYLLRGTDLTENKLVLKDTPKIDATEKDYDAFKTKIGDFLIVRSGTVGTYGIVDVDIPAIFGSYLIDFRFDMEQVTNEFFGYFYQSSLFKSQLNKIIQASANTNINAENIKSTIISLPSLNEQRRISEYLGNLDHLIILHQRKIDKIKDMKKAMLDQIFI